MKKFLLVLLAMMLPFVALMIPLFTMFSQKGKLIIFIPIIP